MGQNHLFSTFSTTSRGKFNGLYLRNETSIYIIGQTHWKLQGSPTSPQNVMNVGPQTASNWTCILPTLCKVCFLLIARLRRRTPANRTQPNFSKRWTVNRANNLSQLGSSVPEKLETKKLYTFVQFFDNFETSKISIVFC